MLNNKKANNPTTNITKLSPIITWKDVQQQQKKYAQIQIVKNTMKYPLGWIKLKRTVATVENDIDKLEPSHNAGGNRKWYSCFAKPFTRCSNNMELLHDPEIPLLGIYTQ